MELEVCESLPVEMDPSSSHCLSLGVGDFKGNKGKTGGVTLRKLNIWLVLVDEQCFWDTGKLYRGVRNTTVTGEQCIKWSHQFHFLPSDYPELAGHNYCRNPGAAEAAPFCYVENSRTELCGVPKCGKSRAFHGSAGCRGCRQMAPTVRACFGNAVCGARL